MKHKEVWDLFIETSYPFALSEENRNDSGFWEFIKGMYPLVPTQRELAKRTGLSIVTVNRYLKAHASRKELIPVGKGRHRRYFLSPKIIKSLSPSSPHFVENSPFSGSVGRFFERQKRMKKPMEMAIETYNDRMAKVQHILNKLDNLEDDQAFEVQPLTRDEFERVGREIKRLRVEPLYKAVR